MQPMRVAAGLLALALASAWERPSAAEGTNPCAERVSQSNVVACAMRASVIVYEEQRGLDAVRARRRSAAVLLPSNPVVAIDVGRRASTTGPDSIDWRAALSQELEIGGQRSSRIEVANAEGDAQRARVQAAEREVAGVALSAYFDALAAQQEKRLADRLVELATALKTLAQARSDMGLASAVDAEIAGAAAIRLEQARFAADRRVYATAVALMALVGLDPAATPVRVEGDLVPLPIADSDRTSLVVVALARRADIVVADAERRAQGRRAEMYRRLRVPNPTVSLFAQSDRYNERAFGVGLAFPIPLPAPIGRTYAGEIAEAEALAERASGEIERVRRSVRIEVLVAANAVASRRTEASTFDPDRIRRADEALTAIARELQARRLSVRDALLAEQSLVELLQAHVEARRQLCLASVELARATGSFNGGTQ